MKEYMLVTKIPFCYISFDFKVIKKHIRLFRAHFMILVLCLNYVSCRYRFSKIRSAEINIYLK